MPALVRDARGRSPYWICAYTTPDGRRLKKSTKVPISPTKGDSKNASKLWEQAMNVCLAWSRLADAGKGRNITETQARRVVAEIYEQSTGEPLHFHSCKDWLMNWIASKNGTIAAGTLTKYTQVIEEFTEHLGRKTAKPLSAISPADIVSFQQHMRERKLAASTINLAIKKTLSAPFAEAHKLGYISMNPVAAVKFLKDSVKARRDVFTQDHIRAIKMAASGSDWSGAVLCGLTTGLRLGDVAKLTWQNVDFAKRLLQIDVQKTDEAMVIPLHSELLSWLKARPHGIGKAPVFPDLYGKKSGGCNGLSARFRKLLCKAGVHGRTIRSGEGGGHRTSSLSFHSLRHTFASAT